MAQVGQRVVEDAIKLSEHAAAAGAQFGIAMNPYHPPGLPADGVRRWYEAFAAGTWLSVDQIAELADMDIVCGRDRARVARPPCRARLPGADVHAGARALPDAGAPA